MTTKQKIILNLLIANCAVLVYPYTITILAIAIALVVFWQARQQVILWLLISTSLISMVLGLLLQPIHFDWQQFSYSINTFNLKFALTIIPVPLIVNLFFINSFFETTN